jgi:uncharacterized protein (TIGR02594 family)
MGLFNKACFVGGAAVIAIGVNGGIDLGGRTTMPPGPGDQDFVATAGGANYNTTPSTTPGSGGTNSGWDPSNLPPGTGPTPWMDSAGNYIGLNEYGENRGDLIDQWNLASNTSLGQPWCASFVNATLAQNGIQGTGSAWSRSFMNWGVDAGGPVTGSVVVFKWNATKGHVGYVHSVNSDGSINVLGGNQSGGVSISRFSTDKVIGYRLPPGQSGGGINVGNGGSGGTTGGLENTR